MSRWVWGGGAATATDPGPGRRRLLASSPQHEQHPAPVHATLHPHITTTANSAVPSTARMLRPAGPAGAGAGSLDGSFIHSAHRPAASCSRAAHFGLGSPGRPPPRAHVRCWRGAPSDRGPLKACAEAGKRGSALLHAWRLEQNRVPPSCGRSFRPTVYGRSHGTRRHGVWAQACCRRRRARGAARRRRRHAATPPSHRAAAVASCQKPTATATGLGGTAFRSTACCRRRRRGAACGGGGTAFGSTACCRCRRRRGAACGGGGSARGNPPRFLASHPPDPVLRFTLFREGLLTAHCSLLIAHCSTLIALYPTQPQDSTAARAPPHLAACAPHPPSMGPAHTGASPLPPTAFSTAPSRGCPHCIHSAPFPAFLVT